MSCITVCFTYTLRMAIFLNTDISQESVATRLGYVGGNYISLCYKFPTESNSERIVKISKYLVKLWATVRCHFFDSRCKCRLNYTTDVERVLVNALECLLKDKHATKFQILRFNNFLTWWNSIHSVCRQLIIGNGQITQPNWVTCEVHAIGWNWGLTFC